MLPKEIEKEVWESAITRYENEVMRYSPASPGRDKDESVLEYANRSRALQKEAMDKLEYALWRSQIELIDYNLGLLHKDEPEPLTQEDVWDSYG